jgi:hypothetical protein
MALAEAAESPEFQASEATGTPSPADPTAPMDGEMPPALAKQMDAVAKRAADAATAPLRTELDALRAEKQTRDAQANAAAESALRSLARGLGVKDAATVALDALVPAAAARIASERTPRLQMPSDDVAG